MDNAQKNIIRDAGDCTVKQFIRCAFEQKYRVLLIEGQATDDELREAFEFIYSQYIDYAGLYETREFEMSAYINSLDNRIQTIKRFTELQLSFIAEFELPFIPGFEMVEKYGHHLYWDDEQPDIEAFKKRLQQIGGKEKKYESILKNKVTELIEFRRRQIKKEFTLLETRKQFMTMLNRLQQQKFVIDKATTTVEELALMIQDSRDQAEEAKMQIKTKK